MTLRICRLILGMFVVGLLAPSGLFSLDSVGLRPTASVWSGQDLTVFSDSHRQLDLSKYEMSFVISPQWFALVEYRYNDYMKSLTGVALGVRIHL